jgi:hypothetical protein
MAQGLKQLVAALQCRYDYHSARAIAADSMDAAGLEKRSDYEDKDWAKLLTAALEIGNELDAVWAALGSAPKGVKLAAPAEPAAAAPPPEEDGASETATPAPAEPPETKKTETKKKATKKKG